MNKLRNDDGDVYMLANGKWTQIGSFDVTEVDSSEYETEEEVLEAVEESAGVMDMDIMEITDDYEGGLTEEDMCFFVFKAWLSTQYPTLYWN